MNINEFERILLMHKIRPVELTSDNSHRIKIIEIWKKADEYRALKIIKRFMIIAAPTYILMLIAQAVIWMNFYDNYEKALAQSLLTAASSIITATLLIICVALFFLIRIRIDCKNAKIYLMENATDYEQVSHFLNFADDVVNLSEAPFAWIYNYDNPVAVYKSAEDDVNIYCGAREKDGMVQMIFERPFGKTEGIY